MKRIDLRVESTSGDFGRSGSGFPVACCSCTCCCMTFVLGGVGAIGGLAWGITNGILHVRRSGDRRWFAILASVLGFVILGVVCGLMIGACAGLAIDLFWLKIR